MTPENATTARFHTASAVSCGNHSSPEPPFEPAPGLFADSAALMSREYAGRFGVGVDHEAWVVTELAGFFISFQPSTCEW